MLVSVSTKSINKKLFNLARLRRSLPGILAAQELNTRKLAKNWIQLKPSLDSPARTIFKLKEGCLMKVGRESTGPIAKITSKTADEVQEKFANSSIEEREEVVQLALQHWRLMKRRAVLNSAMNAFLVLACYETAGVYLDFPDIHQDAQKIEQALKAQERVEVEYADDTTRYRWTVKLKSPEEVEVIEGNSVKLKDQEKGE